jgi:Zn-dependent protease with chaperone function
MRAMPTDDAIAALRPWATGERETFFDAIARHRRAAWRVTAASAVADVVVAVVVAVLMAPIFYAALILACDVVNLVRPMPNLAAIIFARLDPLVDEPAAVPIGDWLTIGALAAAPGLVWMASVLVVMHRAVRSSSVFSGDIPARAPDPHVLEELRFANVIEEMAIAANLPNPRVLVVESTAVNAAVFGPDERRATIVGTSALLRSLSRDELQGVAGDLVSAIANGDMTIGLRVAATLGLFGFIGCMAGSFTDRRAMRRLLGRTIKAAIWPTTAAARGILEVVADPFAPGDAPDDAASTPPSTSEARHDTDAEGWRALVWMPLAGPVAMAGFFAGLINLFVLQPLVSLAWRQRKYMADATAVRLTRDPDTLAGALQAMSRTRGGLFGAWASHLCMVQPAASSRGLFGASFVPSYPSIARRLRALTKMGAHVTATSRAHVPVLVILAAIPVVAILVVLIGIVLYLMAFLSIALSMLFLGIPLGVLHMALRAIAH